ncbi:recombinase RecA [Alteromonas sp. H39]|uniref:recombinase RecA n=1 Tax=Alteromonas sp. H39 TaxID=3389876 RepID=UPI0039DF6836
MAESLTSLEKHPLIWRGNQTPSALSRLSTGHAILDKHLLGGLPCAGLVRVQATVGVGELSLLKGALLSGRRHKLRVFINAPGDVHAPWLHHGGFDDIQTLQITPANDEEALWSAEQCLKSGVCHSVILWISRLHSRQARRLQIAASDNDCLCLIYQHSHIVSGLPILLDLKVRPHKQGLCVDIIKIQGGKPVDNLILPLKHTPDNSVILRLTRQSHHHHAHLSSVS